MYVYTNLRRAALLDSTIVKASRTLTTLSLSVGGGPVTLLDSDRAENPELHAVCKEVASLLAKERLASIGADLRKGLPGSGLASLPPLSASVQAAADILLGMNVMLAGGPTKVASRGMSIADITAAALVVRKKAGEAAVKEETRRAVYMKLAKPGEAGASLLYTLGGAAAHYPFWESYLPARKEELVREILERAADVRTKAGEAAEETRRAVYMKLAKPGEAGASLLYTLGGAAAHYPFWESYLPARKEELVREILKRAADVRKKAGEATDKEETRHAVYMKLAEPGEAGANFLYSLGGSAAHYPFWEGYLPERKAALVLEILQRAADTRDKAGRAGTNEHRRRALEMKLAPPD